MKTSNCIRSITILVLFGILINWCFFSQDSAAAQAQKAPVTQPINPAMPAPPLCKPIIEGIVTYKAIKMGNVEVTLKKRFKNGRWGIVGTQTTELEGYSRGQYKFTPEFDEDITGYKIVPKHPLLSPGDHFSPQEKEIAVSCGTTKIDFTYTGPLPDLIPLSAIKNGNATIIKIKNQGNLAAESFGVFVQYTCNIHTSVEPYIVHTFSVRGLEAGDTKEITDSGGSCHCKPGTNFCPVESTYIKVDSILPYHNFESDKSNNNATFH